MESDLTANESQGSEAGSKPIKLGLRGLFEAIELYEDGKHNSSDQDQ